MNEESPSNPSGQSANPFPGNVRKNVESGVESITAYFKENPWCGVLGGFVLGLAVAAIAKAAEPEPEPTSLERLRALLEDTCEKLPSKKEAKSAVLGVLEKLHIPV